MKKIGIFLCTAAVCAFSSCMGFNGQPVFVSVLGGKTEPVNLISYSLGDKNTAELIFSGKIKELECSAIAGNGKALRKLEPICSRKDALYTESETEQGEPYTVFQVSGLDSIEIGESFLLKGVVTDILKNTMTFELSFKGCNSNPAGLKISEIKPLFSKTKYKENPEFIEFIVTKSGNLSGMQIVNVGDKKNPNYIFPSVEVKKGELVLYYWRGGSNSKEAVSYIQKKIAGRTVKIFKGNFARLPIRKSNAVLIKTSEKGDIQDAVLFFNTKQGREWPTDAIALAAEEAAQAGIWKPDGKPSSAVIYNITPSKSIGVGYAKKSCSTSAGQWRLYDSKYISPGFANR